MESLKNIMPTLTTHLQYMNKSTGPHPPYTYRSHSVMKIQAMKLLAHSYCADVNARGSLELSSY